MQTHDEVHLDGGLEDMKSLLTECRVLGGEMLDAVDHQNFGATARLHGLRAGLLEQVQNFCTREGLDRDALATTAEGREVMELAEELLVQNRRLQVAISRRQSEVLSKLDEISTAQRVSKAYAKWHPVRMAGEQAGM